MALVPTEIQPKETQNYEQEDEEDPHPATKDADSHATDNRDLRHLHTLNCANHCFRLNSHKHMTSAVTDTRRKLIFIGKMWDMSAFQMKGISGDQSLQGLVHTPDRQVCQTLAELMTLRYEKRCKDQGCGQEREYIPADEVGVQQQQRYSLMEQELLHNSLPNKKASCAELTPQELSQALQSLLGVQTVAEVTAELILDVCKRCSQSSKAIVKLLPEIPTDCLTKLKKLLSADLMSCILQENTCYLVRYFIKCDAAMSRKCNMMVFLQLEQMMNQQHTCRLVYTLCSTSESFREDLSIRFKMEFSKYIETLPGAILMSHLVLSTPDLEQVRFIFDELLHNPEIVKSKYFGRAFATYMGRCNEETLNKISELLSKYISFLLQNNYGNYLLQIFFERKNKPGMELCKKALKKAHKKVFLRKYSRFVLLRAVLLDDSAGMFCKEISELVCKDLAAIRSIIIKRLPGDMLLLCISKIQNKLFALELLNAVRSCCQQQDTQNAYQIQPDFCSELTLLKISLENSVALQKHSILYNKQAGQDPSLHQQQQQQEEGVTHTGDMSLPGERGIMSEEVW